MADEPERDAPHKPAPTHEGSVESFARRRTAKQRGRDPEQERAKVAAHARTLRVVQVVVATGLVLGVAYVSMVLWERGRVMPMIGLIAMSVVAIVRVLRGTM
jgi:cytochrome c-type biogenesis protein CcmH/NrfG